MTPIRSRLLAAALLALLLLAPGWAQPASSQVDGWPRWQAPGGPLRYTQGAALADQSPSESLDWLRTQCESKPQSRDLWLALYRRLEAEGAAEEAFGCLVRALDLPDRELLLVAAAGHLKAGRTGPAVEALRRARHDWVEPLESVPVLVRLRQLGFETTPSLGLQRGQELIELKSAQPLGRPLKIGSVPVWRNGSSLIFDDGLCLTTNSDNLHRLLSELSSDGSVSETLGFSVQGRPIDAIRLGSGPETVLLFGAFHGDEPAGPYLLLQLLSLLRAQPERLAGKTVVVVTTLNPDGLKAKTRPNARGVDLNRNYPAKNWNSEGKGSRYWGGPRPASEPETWVVLELLERYRPARILSIHQPLHNVNYDGPAAALAAKLSKANGYPVQPDIGYPTPGSFGTFAGRERSIPTITLELPEGAPDKLWRANRKALLRFLEG